MGATDVEPSRLVAARAAAGTFLSSIPERFRVAVVGIGTRAVVVSPPTEDRALTEDALALLRTARHDADTMTHALGLGRSQARHPSNDETTRRGVRLLESTITYLGVKVQPNEIARPESR